jgi:hypothetical protein
MVPSGSTIPSGWVRDTRWDDGIYLKFAEGGSNPTTGGNASHGHPTTGTSHRHTVTITNGSGSSCPLAIGMSAATGHQHAASYSAYATVSAAAATNDLYYFEMIFIKPSTGDGCPNNACAIWDDASLPTSWTEHSGSKGRYLRGAAAAGAAGGTGGSLTHTHTTNHTHGNSTSGKGNTRRGINSGGSQQFSRAAHTHTISLNSATANAGSASSEPEYKKYRVIQNGTGGEDLPDKIYALFVGSSVPANWARITDADGYFLKPANNDTEVGDTGGNSQHGHTGSSHNGHSVNHSGGATVYADNHGPGSASPYGHNHSKSCGSATVNIPNNTADSHYPSFQEAMLIQYTLPTGGATLQRTLTGVGL